MLFLVPRFSLLKTSALALGVWLLGACFVTAPAAAHNSEQVARLKGRSVVGAKGDKDGRGRAEIKSSAEISTLCYKLWFSDIDPSRSAHIHQAVPGQNGEISLTLFENKKKVGRARGCIRNVDEALLESMQASPQGYYLDLHTRKHPKGALRGQLENVTESDFFETCNRYRPAAGDARRAGTVIVSDAATEDEPLSVTINAPEGTPSDPGEVVINVQLTTQGAAMGFYSRYEFPIGEDYDIIVRDGKGDEKARAAGTNPTAIGPAAGPNGTGGHSEQGAEQIDGLKSEHCDGYTLRLVTNSGLGGKLALKLWTGEGQYP